MLNIGLMRHRITIQRGTEMKVGPRVDTAWTDFVTVWAEIVKQSANEFLTGFGEAEARTVIFRIRYRADITTVDKIMFDGVAHDIKEISEIGWRDGLELRAVAVS